MGKAITNWKRNGKWKYRLTMPIPMGNGNIFEGCIPALMTPCDTKGNPDFSALVRKAKHLSNCPK